MRRYFYLSFCCEYLFFFIRLPSPNTYTLSLHDALPILIGCRLVLEVSGACPSRNRNVTANRPMATPTATHGPDRKSTRLNSSHVAISYAVFCLKKKIKIVLSVRRPHDSTTCTILNCMSS